MDAIVEDLSQSKKLIRFSIPHERVAGEIEAALGHVRKTASIKGFRPGHVPERILRARFGDEIRNEAISRLVPQVFREAIVENKLRPVGEPDVKDLKYNADEPLTFTATVEVLPDFALPEYKGVRVVAHKIEPPSESEVEDLLQSYRESRAILAPVEGRPVQMGDSVIVTIEQTVDGKTETMKDLPLEVAEDRLLPGLAGALVGIGQGGTKHFELAVPDEYRDKAIAGKTMACAATVSEIKEKRLPELTDEFAKEVANVESVDALRERIRTMISEQRRSDERRRQEGVVLDALVDGTDFEVPESLLRAQTERNIARAYQRAELSGVPREKVVERHDEIVKNASVASARQIKLTLLFERIAEAEGIRVTDEDLSAFYERAASVRGTTSDQVREAYEKQEGALEALRDELLENKVRSFLMANAEIG
jgi:trigger factor